MSANSFGDFGSPQNLVMGLFTGGVAGGIGGAKKFLKEGIVPAGKLPQRKDTAEAVQAQRAALRRGGRSSTILTSGRGLIEDEPLATRTVLG